jgi:hypothetical protein
MKVSVKMNERCMLAMTYANRWTWYYLSVLCQKRTGPISVSFKHLPNRGGHEFSVTTINVRRL